MPGEVGVLEGVVQQVHQRGREELRIDGDDQRRIDAVHHQLDLPGVGVHLRGDGDLADEPSQRHPITVVKAGLEADLRQCAVDEVPQAHDAAGKHRTGAPADADGATLQGFEREERGVDLVPELMSESPQTEHLLTPARFLQEPSMLGDGLGDRRVEAAIQSVEVLGTDQRSRSIASSVIA